LTLTDTYYFVIRILILILVFSVHQALAQTKQAYLNAGSKAMEEGDYYTASIHFTKALAFDEQDASTIFKLAESHRLFNDYREAAAGYTRYLSIEQKNKNKLALFYLGEMKKNLGEYAEAKKIFTDYYSIHAGDSDLFAEKSRLRIASCDTAEKLLKDSVPSVISNLGSKINSVYSDFAGQQMFDSTLYYSSQRFIDKPKGREKKSSYISKILKSYYEDQSWQPPEPMDRIFNPSGYLDCNSSISADHKLLVFSRCRPISVSSYHAELYYSKWEKGKWQNPVKIGKEVNDKTYTATQPCIAANGANGYILYFVSDRPGGTGGLDIWKSSYINGQFSKCENLGEVVNTKGDEVTPFFDNLNSTLYFSSDWHAGMGGYDIFKSVLSGQTFSNPANIGYPVNSSCNDIYFSNNGSDKKGLLTSNRPGSMYLQSETCCYDIYSFELQERKPPPVDSAAIRDSIILAEKMLRVSDSTTLTIFLPLKLYFDNDQPGRRSLDTITRKSYDETYFEYLAQKPEYLHAFKNKNGVNNNMTEAVENFFTTTIGSSYKDLDRFSIALAAQLLAGRQITLTVQGTASPLAKSDYNDRLSKRRINSLLNYFRKYNDGIIQGYIDKRQLVIIEEPAGEMLAPKTVSDNYYDKRKSVYHPDACLERRIEVIAIRYEN